MATDQRLDQRITTVETKPGSKIDMIESKIDKLDQRIKGLVCQASVGILLGGLTIGGVLIRLQK